MTAPIDKIRSDLAWHDFVALRMLRRWVAARDAHESPLRSLGTLGRELNLSADLAVAFDSLFQLVEDRLGRALNTECCCNREMSADERAVLILIATVSQSSRGHPSSAAMPHGISGPLCWAVGAVRSSLGSSMIAPSPSFTMGCPFIRSRWL